jgi:hypothetical protein
MTFTGGFPGGSGGTTTPADSTSLMDDLEEGVFDPMDDATWIYSGHGKDTTARAPVPMLRRPWQP